MNGIWTSETTTTSLESRKAPARTRENPPIENSHYSTTQTGTSRLKRRNASRKSPKHTLFSPMTRNGTSTISLDELESMNDIMLRIFSAERTSTRSSATSAELEVSSSRSSGDSAASAPSKDSEPHSNPPEARI